MPSQEAYGCVNCQVTEADKDRFEIVYRGSQPRIKLKLRGSTTLLHCPKCGAQHIHPEFINEQADELIRAKKSRQRIETMKEVYVTLKLPIKEKKKT